MEHKQLSLNQTEFKFGSEGSLEFSGYASVFNGVDSYGDTIKPGAYKGTLEQRERPVALRWQHWGPIIGKFTEMFEDEKGLFVRGELTKGHSTAEDTAALLRHGAISGLSIGYIAKDFSETEYGGRVLKDIELFEISVVEEPADNSAHISTVKSVFDECATLKEVEQAMRRHCGLSQSVSTAIVSAVKNAVNRSESESEQHALDEVVKSINSKFQGE